MFLTWTHFAFDLVGHIRADNEAAFVGILADTGVVVQVRGRGSGVLEVRRGDGSVEFASTPRSRCCCVLAEEPQTQTTSGEP